MRIYRNQLIYLDRGIEDRSDVHERVQNDHK